MKIEEILKTMVGAEIVLSYVHHAEGVLRTTEGKLIGFDKEVIVMEVQDRTHFWERWKPVKYHLNRQSCSLLSVTLNEKAEVSSR